MGLIENLEGMLASGQDSAMLRYSLGSAYLDQGATTQAIEHLRRALDLDPQYSAAWKSYAQALAQSGQTEEAMSAYEKGIEVAEAKGDKQAAKEMGVFLRRLRKGATGER